MTQHRVVTQPTPRPWTIGTSETRHIDGSPPTHNLTIVAKSSERLITDFGVPQRIGAQLRPEDLENAKFVVRAVNLHDDLVSALEHITMWAEEHINACKRDGQRPAIDRFRVKAARSTLNKVKLGATDHES